MAPNECMYVVRDECPKGLMNVYMSLAKVEDKRKLAW